MWGTGCPSVCRIHSAVLCIVFLVFQERRKGKKQLSSGEQQLLAHSIWVSRVVTCYKKLI
jgi:hypothetical protein